MEGAERSSSVQSLIGIYAELFGVVTIWAGTFVATKVLLLEIPPAISALYRYVLASTIIIVLDYRNSETIERRDYPMVGLLSLTGVTFYYLLQHWGIRYTDATDAAILISLSPVFIALIAWVFLGEKPGFTAGCGLAIAFAGAVTVIYGSGGGLTGGTDRVWGNVLILLTAISWAAYSVYGKKLLGRYSVRTIIKYNTVWGTFGILPFTVPEFLTMDHYALSLTRWICLVYLGGAASVYGYLAWYRALAKLTPVTVGSYLYFRPLLTGVIASILLGEVVSVSLVIGGGMIILGTYLSAQK